MANSQNLCYKACANTLNENLATSGGDDPNTSATTCDLQESHETTQVNSDPLKVDFCNAQEGEDCSQARQIYVGD